MFQFSWIQNFSCFSITYYEDMAKQRDEAINIFKNLKEIGAQLLTLVNTLTEKIMNSELGVENDISLLDVKNQLMIQYLLNLAQVIILKTTGKSIEGNTTVDRLIEDRIILERCKPIEQKFKYQIEKYVKRAVVGFVEETNPSKYKSNPGDMMLMVSNNDEDSKDEITEKQSKECREKQKSDVYVPPKLTSVPYDRLIEDRLILERCKPIEQKLKHQIEKCVKRAVIGFVEINDPSRYKSNPGDMMLKVSNNDEDSKDEITEKQSKEFREKQKSDGYIPPKLTSVPYEKEKHIAKKQKKVYEPSRTYALRSSVTQELKKEYLDKPLEVKATNSVLQREDKYQKKKREYEERYYTHLPVTKEEKRSAKFKFPLDKISNKEVTRFEDTSILHGESAIINKKRKRIQKKGKAKKSKRRKFH